MAASIYFDVVIKNDSYFVREMLGSSTDEVNLASLETIKEILKRRLPYEDENQEMKPAELALRKITLLEKLGQVAQEAAQRCAAQEPFFRWAVRKTIWKTPSNSEQLKTEIDARLAIEKNKMLPLEERRFLPELPFLCVELIVSYLTLSNLAVFAKINQNARQLQEREVWDRVLSYGYIGPSIKALQEDLHILKEVFPQTHSLEETLRQIQECVHSDSLFKLISMIAKAEDVAKLQALLRFGMDPNSREHIEGDEEAPFYKVKKSLSKNVLGEFVLEGCVPGVRVLLEHKADPNVPMIGNLFPLHLIAGRGNLTDGVLAHLLLLFGAKPAVVDSDGFSPLELAAARLDITNLKTVEELHRFLLDPIAFLLLVFKAKALQDEKEGAI